jgi:CheY-like chemotaxis protein
VEGGSAGSTRTRRTVLIADDEPSIRELVQVTIGADDINVVEASDGDEAWSLIQAHQPSLVLLDVQMPGRTGLEILSAIRADARLAGTKVIILSASAAASDMTGAVAAGADSYLTKPFSPRDLLLHLDEALLL